jgi:AcrR family transcriptional regulator
LESVAIQKQPSATTKKASTAKRKPRVESPRDARLARRRDRTRDDILDASRAVILRDGLKAFTLDAVAQELGLTKPALYYYFESRDALLRELVYRLQQTHAQHLHDAVETTKAGGDALCAIVRATISSFAPRLDDFRLTYLHGQLAGAGAVEVGPEDLARIRPLNDLAYAGAARRVSESLHGKKSRAGVEPRLLVFLANLASLGVLTMKGLVESVDDPLLYSDEQLIVALSRVFAAAAEPVDR